MVITEISTLLSAAKSAYDLAKGVGSLYVEAERKKAAEVLQERLFSIQEYALAVQELLLKLQQEKYEVEKKMADFENWGKTEASYELKEIAPGVFVYVSKMIVESAGTKCQPLHWLCPNCYGSKKKSILQHTSTSYDGAHHICHACKSEILDRTKAKDIPPIGTCKSEWEPFT
ncbi:hypothetical protein METP2_03860 [Methanosarcinales archaeon]|nr:hypothetical protein METP2_03860 [Methanosarcinales archaeon]